ncbi:unnamed protein product [Vicia faba]|uniref:Uncharacterized protein n=1 Tax=Vicia faba TaxID=3906 RepID=A0AAV0ZJW5_VICFA|nr:unnamed protein product [Vicia faba]
MNGIGAAGLLVLALPSHSLFSSSPARPLLFAYGGGSSQSPISSLGFDADAAALSPYTLLLRSTKYSVAANTTFSWRKCLKRMRFTNWRSIWRVYDSDNRKSMSRHGLKCISDGLFFLFLLWILELVVSLLDCLLDWSDLTAKSRLLQVWFISGLLGSKGKRKTPR